MSFGPILLSVKKCHFRRFEVNPHHIFAGSNIPHKVDSQQMSLVQDMTKIFLACSDHILPSVLSLGKAVNVDGWQDIRLLQILLLVSKQSVENVNKGDGQSGEVHHNVSRADLISVGAPDFQHFLLNDFSDEVSSIQVESLCVLCTLFVISHILFEPLEALRVEIVREYWAEFPTGNTERSDPRTGIEQDWPPVISDNPDDSVVFSGQTGVPVHLGEVQREDTAALLHRHHVVIQPCQQLQAEVPVGVVDRVTLVDDGLGSGQLQQSLPDHSFVRLVVVPQVEVNNVADCGEAGDALLASGENCFQDIPCCPVFNRETLQTNTEKEKV